MDKIYNFKRSTAINIKDELKAWQKELNLDDPDKSYIGKPENIQKAMKLCGGPVANEKYLENLEQSVSLDINLSQDDDVRVVTYDPAKVRNRRPPVFSVPKKAQNLLTYTAIKELRKLKNVRLFDLNYLNYGVPDLSSLDQAPTDLIPYHDVLISIKVYRPFSCNASISTQHPKFSEEFLVLGSQKLTELKDKINCRSNDGPIYEISENPFEYIPPNDIDSGFFFITDTFYNDQRSPKHIDYSGVIKDWSIGRKDFPELTKSARMEETKFIDLTVQLGQPQCFQHFGNCEHIFIFSSIQLLSGQDNLCSKNYPILKAFANLNDVLCNICGRKEYVYMVEGSKKHIISPVFLCRDCFISYHYINGKKIGEFKAYKLNLNDVVEILSEPNAMDEVSE